MSRKTPARPTPAPHSAEPEFLTDREGAVLLNLGMTRFLDLQKRDDFPPPVWLGPRGKRHIRARLIDFALSKTERVPA